MKKWIANWAISGFRGAEHVAGNIIEAAEDEIAELIVGGSVSAFVTKHDDLTKCTPEELIAYAKEKFGYDLEADLTKDAMLAELASLANGTDKDDPDSGPADPGKPVDKMNKSELVAHAKAAYGFNLDPSLSKAAMQAEIGALAAQKD